MKTLTGWSRRSTKPGALSTGEIRTGRTRESSRLAGSACPPEIVKAQTRLRTAAWRNRMDRRRAPTGREVGMALVAALITSSMSEIMESSDRGILAKALVDLDRRGFSVTEAKATLRRLRDRHVEHDDRKGDGGLPF
ncbi:hypothetical protein ACVWZL_005987 [Bradyrhizobium sp. GM2.4]